MSQEWFIDRDQYEPPAEEIVNFLAEFSTDVIDQAEADGLLYEMITEWSQEKIIAYQKSLVMAQMAYEVREAILNDGDNIPNIDI